MILVSNLLFKCLYIKKRSISIMCKNEMDLSIVCRENYKNCLLIMRTTILAAIAENSMQPTPSALRLLFSVLMPNMKSTTVIAANTSDIAIIENQYKILNTAGAMELSLFK
ncbi:hypothetical protein D3C76_805450 [compost metagenome]